MRALRTYHAAADEPDDDKSVGEGGVLPAVTDQRLLAYASAMPLALAPAP
jgi:hypothetical protein